MGRLRTAALVTTTLAAGAATVTAPRRWAGADDPTCGRPLELPDGAERTVRGADGAVIAAWQMGDPAKPPIVLAHGWTAERRVWATVARRLVADGHHVVCFDQRGHGASRPGSDGLTISALARDLVAVLEDLDAGGAVVAGHSMGGIAAQALAAEHPEVVARRVAHLVLVSTVALNPGSPDGRYPRTLARISGSGAATRLVGGRRTGPYLVRASAGSHPSIVALRATAESHAATPAATRSELMAEMGRIDLTAALPSIRVPTTVVYGTRDLLTPPRANRRIASSIPGARRVVLPGRGHQLVFEAPDRLADVIAEAAGGPAHLSDPLPRSLP